MLEERPALRRPTRENDRVAMRPSFYGRAPKPSVDYNETCSAHLPVLQAPGAQARSCGSTSRSTPGDDASDASTLSGSMFSSTSSSGNGSRPSFYNRPGATSERRLWASRTSVQREQVATERPCPQPGVTPPCIPRRSFYDRARFLRQVSAHTTRQEEDKVAVASTREEVDKVQQQSLRNNAALRLQSWCRGCWARQRVADHRRSEAEAQLVVEGIRTAAAIQIQRRYRAHLAEAKERLATEMLRNAAATQIQRRYRTRHAEFEVRRVMLEALRSAAAVEIQRRCRGQRARQVVAELLVAKRRAEAEAAAKAAAVASAAAKATSEGWLRLSGTRRWADSEPEDSDEDEFGSTTRTATWSLTSGCGGFASATASTMGSDSPEGPAQRADEVHEGISRSHGCVVAQDSQPRSNGGKSSRRRRKKKSAKYWQTSSQSGW